VTKIASHATVLLVDDVAAQLDYYRDKLGMHDFRVRDPEGYILAFGKIPE
jgi:catechol 2,3-dioxygenase-like lactoylglutathione lyase family enzyme